MRSELDRTIESLVTDYHRRGTSKPVRFSVGFHPVDNRRSEYIAKTLGISKQELISKLYLAALEDLELKLHFQYIDDKDKQRKVTEEYMGMITSTAPIETFFEDEE